MQRKTGAGAWQDYADQSGEIPVTLKFPALDGAATYLTGQRWEWTAHFEAFVSDIDTGSRSRDSGGHLPLRGRRRQPRRVRPPSVLGCLA